MKSSASFILNLVMTFYQRGSKPTLFYVFVNILNNEMEISLIRLTRAVVNHICFL